MLIYNTSFHVSGERTLQHFLTYMRDNYLPAISQGGLLQNIRFVRLLTDIGDDQIGYCVMADVDDIKALKKWKLDVGNAADTSFHHEFGEQVLTFSSTMKVIELPDPSRPMHA